MMVRHFYALLSPFKILLLLGIIAGIGLSVFILFAPQKVVPLQDVILLQQQGVLDVQVEYYQAQLGLSLVRDDGEFRPLKTTHEWWLDAQNPHRFRRATIEWLEDGPHLVGADGSDGISAWWEVDWTRGIVLPVTHKGLYLGTASTFEEWTSIFSTDGQKWLEQVRLKKAQIISESTHALWGKIIVIKQVDAARNTITATVRANNPTILIERVVIDRNGNLFETEGITTWQWLETKQLEKDFWMTPPKDIPVGP
jgi:hypothetical protein